MSTNAVVFSQLWQKMKDAAVEPADAPVVLGGQLGNGDCLAFLNKWQTSGLKLPWRIWEYVSSIAFGASDEIPQELKHLQRAELFGEGGHLSLRREGNRWRWHLVGPAKTTPPVNINAEPWQSDDGAILRCYKEQAILWGKEVVREKDGKETGIGLWWEDRVGAADLKYPGHLSGIARVYLHFDRYTQAGRTVFVQYKGLGDEQEVKSWPK